MVVGIDAVPPRLVHVPALELAQPQLVQVRVRIRLFNEYEGDAFDPLRCRHMKPLPEPQPARDAHLLLCQLDAGCDRNL